jgi:hypothetical protein
MALYHGRKGMVYMSTSGSGNATAMVALTEWSLNMATDRVEVTAFGDANKTYVQGLKDLTGTISGFWNDANDALFDASDSTDGVKVYLYPSTDAPSKYFYGPAWVDASITTGVNAAVSISGTLAANGSWGRQT